MFQPKRRLKKCSIGKPQPLQSEPVAVQMVDTDRTRLKFRNAAILATKTTST